jgi:hypothetical protein
MQNAKLTQPAAFSDMTATLYRFETDIKGNEILTLDVIEERPVFEKLMLNNLQTNTLLIYSSNEDLPDDVRAVLADAYNLKLELDNAKKAVSELETRRLFFVGEQERVRANLAAVGAASSAGKTYLTQLTKLDADIATATSSIDDAHKAVEAAQKNYEDFVAALQL